MRRLLVLLSFLATVANLSAAPTKPAGSVVALDPNSDRLTELFRTPNLDAQATIEQLREALSNTTAELANLKDTLAQVQQKQGDVVALNTSLQAQKDSLEQASAASAARIKELEAAQSGLTQQVAESGKTADELAQLKEQLKAQEDASLDLNTQLADAKKHAAELEAAATKDASADSASASQLQALTVERDALRETVKTQEEKLLEAEKTLQARDAAAKGTEHSTEDRLIELTDQVATLEREKSEAVAHSADLETQLTERDSTDEKYKALAEQYEQLKAAHDEMAANADKLALVTDQKRSFLAQEQWTALLQDIIQQLQPHAESFSQICATLATLQSQTNSLALQAKEAAAGRTKALEMNRTLRTEKSDLAKQLAKLAEFDAKVKELEAQKAALDESVKQLTAAGKDKDEKIAALTAQLQDLQSQLESSAAAMEELQESQIAPAAQLRAQLVALKQLMGTFVSQIQRQLTAIGEKTTPLAEYIEAAKANEQKLRDFARTIKKLEDNVREFMDLAKQVSKQGSKGSSDSSTADAGEVRRLQDQVASLTAQYNQLAKEANDRVDSLQAQLVAQARSTTDGSGVKDELARLQRQLDDERSRRETAASIAQATLAAKVDSQDRGFMQAQLDAQRDRQTDVSASTTQAMAGQAFAASMAASAASKSAAPSSSPVVVTLSGLQSDLSRLGQAPTQQFINGMPAQYQPYMNSMAGLPQFGVPSSMGQLTATTNLLAQNRRTYVDTYKKIIDFLRSPASRNNVQAFNSLEATTYSAVSREGYLWYTRAISATNPSVKAEAVNHLKELLEVVARPLQALKAEIETQTGSKDYRQPEDLVAKFSGFITQLGGAA